ncbi:MAG TPA: undecaprenyldiphospho-muramoylpentapeptide beta-N-acetylglucosaminyltransferase, partial [Burkholderiales bacterium]
MIMAGGTGGHVFPGLAVAHYLREAGWRVVWLGAKTGMEATLVPKHGYEMAWVSFSGLRGKGPATLFLLPTKLLLAFWQSARAILAARPDVVLGMGGYMSFPGGMMAALLGKPLVVHEQNSVPGLANKVLASVADRVLCAFPGALKRGTVTGNPVRPEIAAIAAPESRYVERSGPLRVLVVGGSLGAKALNDIVPRALALLTSERPLLTHQSGAQHVESLRQAYSAAGVSAKTPAFIENMAAAYAEADLVVCRAGATTVAEIAAAGVASILVPYPHAVDDHQTANARFLTDAG